MRWACIYIRKRPNKGRRGEKNDESDVHTGSAFCAGYYQGPLAQKHTHTHTHKSKARCPLRPSEAGAKPLTDRRRNRPAFDLTTTGATSLHPTAVRAQRAFNYRTGVRLLHLLPSFPAALAVPLAPLPLPCWPGCPCFWPGQWPGWGLGGYSLSPREQNRC
jgi:hypothetical protein